MSRGMDAAPVEMNTQEIQHRNSFRKGRPYMGATYGYRRRERRREWGSSVNRFFSPEAYSPHGRRWK